MEIDKKLITYFHHKDELHHLHTISRIPTFFVRITISFLLQIEKKTLRLETLMHCSVVIEIKNKIVLYIFELAALS